MCLVFVYVCMFLFVLIFPIKIMMHIKTLGELKFTTTIILIHITFLIYRMCGAHTLLFFCLNNLVCHKSELNF